MPCSRWDDDECCCFLEGEGVKVVELGPALALGRRRANFSSIFEQFFEKEISVKNYVFFGF